MMNFYCSEKLDKTNWFDSDWGAIQNKRDYNKGKTTEQGGGGFRKDVMRPLKPGSIAFDDE